MKKILFLIFVFLFFNDVFACSCNRSNVEESLSSFLREAVTGFFSNDYLVFIGTLESINKEEKSEKRVEQMKLLTYTNEADNYYKTTCQYKIKVDEIFSGKSLGNVLYFEERLFDRMTKSCISKEEVKNDHFCQCPDAYYSYSKSHPIETDKGQKRLYIVSAKKKKMSIYLDFERFNNIFQNGKRFGESKNIFAKSVFTIIENMMNPLGSEEVKCLHGNESLPEEYLFYTLLNHPTTLCRKEIGTKIEFFSIDKIPKEYFQLKEVLKDKPLLEDSCKNEFRKKRRESINELAQRLQIHLYWPDVEPYCSDKS